MHKIVMLAAGIILARAAGATEVAVVIPRDAPTLSEVGLGALVVIMAAAAGWAMRRKK